jgi:uncharacterized protein
VGLESAFLNKLPELIFCALGTIAQIFIGKRLGLHRALNLIFALTLALIFACVAFSPESLHRFETLGYGLSLVDSGLTLWYWTLTAAALVLLLRNRVPAQFRSERRAFLHTSTALLCAAPAVALGAGVITRKDFEVKEIDIKVPGLPKDLQGLRLLQLSDIHLGHFYSAGDLARVVDASNSLRADLIFVTGDLITTKWDPLDRCLAELARLRNSSGIWGCLGNHEQHQKIQNYTTAKAKQFDIHFLRKEAMPLKFGKETINLIGVDHQRHGSPYLEHVKELIVPGDFNLLLSHNPDVFPVAARMGFQLTLAGHTHGGQINLPLAGGNLNIVDLVTPYTKGLYTLPDASLYVNSGLGTIGVPVRLGAPPEITVIRLCAS